MAGSIDALFRCTHNCAEGAGAAGYAAVRQDRGRLAGRKVAAILTGANIDRDVFASVLARGADSS